MIQSRYLRLRPDTQMLCAMRKYVEERQEKLARNILRGVNRELLGGRGVSCVFSVTAIGKSDYGGGPYDDIHSLEFRDAAGKVVREITREAFQAFYHNVEARTGEIPYFLKMSEIDEFLYTRPEIHTLQALSLGDFCYDRNKHIHIGALSYLLTEALRIYANLYDAKNYTWCGEDILKAAVGGKYEEGFSRDYTVPIEGDDEEFDLLILRAVEGEFVELKGEGD